MGQCMSSSTTAAARTSTTTRASPPSKDTALVLMPSGELREYPRQTTSSLVLADASTSSPNSSDWFLCDADVIGFDGPVPPLLPTDPLRAGQIYFVLPAAARRKGLTREEVAALAVKASHALSSRAALAAASATAASGKRRRGAVVAPLVFAPPEEDEVEERRVKEAFKAAKAPPVRRQAPRVRSGKRLERFASDLDAIPECERDDE